MNSNIETGKLCNVYMKIIFSSVDLTYCQLYLDLTSWGLPSTVVSVNNREGGAMWEK